ncbi:putative secretion ATPase (PEP-CTERM system associated) [Pseudoduganella lurida]|uniref:Putative secretion ATPase (PEP-CTERM system associated) n=1 Tax=Pseudoduganella lurida TaxID=1036180 RepID=A0A562R1S2_9BURK|nr:XrtA/PEP-CTERM system-associated ATPase [Pseudoduganella lurida]TWI63008.1 putative secretion ATPase (PEP-CTERM system associated) [Pseudoduganella lurida]
MYETYYGLREKPFRLRPDPQFFFGSRGHKRAMAYLEYGLAQGEGFIVITGDVGAGKTTLVRKLLHQIASDSIVAAHIVNTHLEADDIVRGVVAAFGLPFEDSASKTTLLARLETFLHGCEEGGKRALLVVDEAQNLTPRVVEELRMLSNFQRGDRPLLQTFLLGQPEFRATLHSPDMAQLRQRVIATYHLGPMDEPETRAYIEHRLRTVGWEGDPAITPAAFAAIYQFTGGVPRKTNHLCDRLMLMGFLEELHAFTAAEVDAVIGDIGQEFTPPVAVATLAGDAGLQTTDTLPASGNPDVMDERMLRLEKSMGSVLSILKRMVSTPAGPIDSSEQP